MTTPQVPRCTDDVFTPTMINHDALELQAGEQAVAVRLSRPYTSEELVRWREAWREATGPGDDRLALDHVFDSLLIVRVRANSPAAAIRRFRRDLAARLDELLAAPVPA